MDELVRWLGEQLDADAAPIAMPNWHEPYCMDPNVEDGRCFYCGGEEDPTKVTYQARSPEWLHEVEAKRELLRLAVRAHDYHETFMSGFAAELERVLRMFALAYKDRPGYLEKWRP